MSTWKYNRMYARQAATPIEKVTDPTVLARLDKVLALPGINDWERTFCTSIRQAHEKYKSLTKGQYDTFLKVEGRHDAGAVAEREEWFKNFTPEMMGNWQLMIKYYSDTAYYKGAVDRWQKDNNYVPTQKEYEGVCNNIYAKRMIKQVAIPPRFSIGNLCVVRRWGTYQLATILEVGEVTSPTKGSRVYKLTFIGGSDLFETFEKDLLHYRPSLDKKISLPVNDSP